VVRGVVALGVPGVGGAALGRSVNPKPLDDLVDGVLTDGVRGARRAVVSTAACVGADRCRSVVHPPTTKTDTTKTITARFTLPPGCGSDRR